MTNNMESQGTEREPISQNKLYIENSMLSEEKLRFPT